MLKNIPNTDVVMFDKMVCSAMRENVKYKEYTKKLQPGTLYGSMNDSGVFFIFCSCYSLNRKAMERIINLHEEKLLPPDTPFNDKKITGSFAIENLAIQDPSLKTRKVETYDKIWLDTSKYGMDEKCAENKPVVEKTNKPQQPQAKPVKKPVVVRTNFKTNSKLQEKRRIEPTPTIKVFSHKQKKNHITLVDKRQKKTQVVYTKTASYNKLYDV